MRLLRDTGPFCVLRGEIGKLHHALTGQQSHGGARRRDRTVGKAVR